MGEARANRAIKATEEGERLSERYATNTRANSVKRTKQMKGKARKMVSLWKSNAIITFTIETSDQSNRIKVDTVSNHCVSITPSRYDSCFVDFIARANIRFCLFPDCATEPLFRIHLMFWCFYFVFILNSFAFSLSVSFSRRKYVSSSIDTKS